MEKTSEIRDILFQEYDNRPDVKKRRGLNGWLERSGMDPDTAADLALRAIEQAIPTYQAGRPALPYLVTIAKNLRTDTYRHNPDRETRQSFGKEANGKIHWQRPWMKLDAPGGLRIFMCREGKRWGKISLSAGGGPDLSKSIDFDDCEGAPIFERIADTSTLPTENDYIGIDAPIGRELDAGFTLAEIAAYLGISEVATRKRLERERAKGRKELEYDERIANLE